MVWVSCRRFVSKSKWVGEALDFNLMVPHYFSSILSLSLLLSEIGQRFQIPECLCAFVLVCLPMIPYVRLMLQFKDPRVGFKIGDQNEKFKE